MNQTGMVLFSGNSHPVLAQAIAKHLDVRLGSTSVYHRTNKETMAEIHDSVRGKDVYIVQTGGREVNDCIMELLILCYACKSASARRIIGVIPYMPYSRQTKMRRRGNISMKLLAQLLVKSGFDHIITVDLHSKESLGFFDCAVDNIRASPFLLQYIQESIDDYSNGVIVAKNALATKRATSYADRLRIGFAVIHGELKDFDDADQDDGRASPPPDRKSPLSNCTTNTCSRQTTPSGDSSSFLPTVNTSSIFGSNGVDEHVDEETGPSSTPVTSANSSPNHRVQALMTAAAAVSASFSSRPRYGSVSERVTSVGIGVSLPPLAQKEKPPLTVVGDVKGKVAIMVDDIIDDVQQFVDAAQVLKENGARKIYALATHAVISDKNAPNLIMESAIDEVIVTNTIPHDSQKLQCDKIKTIDISILVAEAIRRINNNESMSHLFRYVTFDD